jgi:hypothetical protein
MQSNKRGRKEHSGKEGELQNIGLLNDFLDLTTKKSSKKTENRRIAIYQTKNLLHNEATE